MCTGAGGRGRGASPAWSPSLGTCRAPSQTSHMVGTECQELWSCERRSTYKSPAALTLASAKARAPSDGGDQAGSAPAQYRVLPHSSSTKSWNPRGLPHTGSRKFRTKQGPDPTVGDSGASPQPVRVTTSCVSPHPSPALILLPLVLQSPTSASPCSLCRKRRHTAQQSEHLLSKERPAVFCGGQSRDARSGGLGSQPPRGSAGLPLLGPPLPRVSLPPSPDPQGLHWACWAGGSPHIPTALHALPAGPPPGAPTTPGPSLGSHD